MRIFAVSDLHLPGNMDKAMDIFGAHWQGHWEKIKADWTARVAPQDIVLIPGDISWAMQLQAAVSDLQDIATLPGRKVLIKGNHDYWWNSPARIRDLLPADMFILQNDALCLDDLLLCGTRGWLQPDSAGFGIEDNKIYARELIRLRLSLDAMRKLRKEGQKVIAMLHYPPHNMRHDPSEISTILEEYQVNACVYGHLHNSFPPDAAQYDIGGVTYYLTSCDYLGFQLKEIIL